MKEIDRLMQLINAFFIHATILEDNILLTSRILSLIIGIWKLLQSEEQHKVAGTDLILMLFYSFFL